MSHSKTESERDQILQEIAAINQAIGKYAARVDYLLERLEEIDGRRAKLTLLKGGLAALTAPVAAAVRQAPRAAATVGTGAIAASAFVFLAIGTPVHATTQPPAEPIPAIASTAASTPPAVSAPSPHRAAHSVRPAAPVYVEPAAAPLPSTSASNIRSTPARQTPPILAISVTTAPALPTPGLPTIPAPAPPPHPSPSCPIELQLGTLLEICA